jgi:hypothetical protein
MALGLFVLSGCSSLKKTQASGAPQNATARERVDSLAASYAEWSTVSMPVRLSISEPKQFSVTAQCVMRRNAYVSMSVRMLGFEVASVWIDNDSVHAIDKYHKRYLSEDFRRFMGGADVTIGDLQDLLLGRAFVVGADGGTLTPALCSRLRADAMAEGLMLLPAQEPASFSYGFVLDDTANTLAAATVLAGDRHAVVVNYSDYYATPAGNVASRVAIETVKGRRIAVALGWNLKSAKWNAGNDRTWKMPSGYTRVSSAQLVQMLSSF